MLSSNSQKAVDDAAEAILKALEDYLNDDGFGICPWLLLIVLIMMYVVYKFVQKKKNQNFKDNTPVVDYDINDDN